MAKFDPLNLAFPVTQAQLREDISDEDYKMLLLLAINEVARGLIASQSGASIVSDSVTIPNGASSVDVEFTTPFSATPIVTGLTVVKPGLGSEDISPFTVHSLTASGFTVVLSASVSSTGYLLHYSAK